jgi:hypothetical protein
MTLNVPLSKERPLGGESVMMLNLWSIYGGKKNNFFELLQDYCFLDEESLTRNNSAMKEGF